MEIEYYWDLVQGSDMWHKLRRGTLTASEMKQFITLAKLETANNKDSRAIVYKKAYERLFNYEDDHFESYDMMRGKIEEVYAKHLYSDKYEQIKECGFVTNQKLGFKIGYSPDGMVGENGQVEVKSRKEHLQFETIIANEVPSEFKLQNQTGLWVTKREWCDFLSYSNGLPMYKNRVYAEEKAQNAIEKAAVIAEERIQEMMDKFKAVVNDLDLPPSPRRDMESGALIKPSHEGLQDEPLNVLGAG